LFVFGLLLSPKGNEVFKQHTKAEHTIPAARMWGLTDNEFSIVKGGDLVVAGEILACNFN
jgi:hypothetical protein